MSTENTTAAADPADALPALAVLRDRSRQALAIVILALACFASAQLAGLISVAGAYTAPLWPAAGIAVAGMIGGSLRLWPGVWLGLFAFHVVAFRASPHLAVEVVAGCALATAAAGQALVGAWYARRRYRAVALGEGSSVLRLQLVAGPVACVILPTVATGWLWATGRGSAEMLAGFWLVCWVANCTGVLVVAPLVSLFTPAGRNMWGGRAAVVALPLIGAGVLMTLCAHVFFTIERMGAREPLRAEALRAQQTLEDRLQASAEAVAATADFVAASQAVTAAEFSRFASRRTGRLGVRALEWLPRVDGAERAAFEATVSRERGAPYRILARAPGGGMVEAPLRPDHFPVLHLEPVAGNEAATGFDAGTEAKRRAMLERARDTGRPVASEAVPLVQGGMAGVLLAVPVYHDNDTARPPEPAERRARLRGFVIGVLQPDLVAARLTPAGTGDGITFELADVSAGDAGHRFLDAAPGEHAEPDVLAVRDVAFHGRTWRLRAFAPADYWTAGQSVQSRIMLLAALAGVFMICLFTLEAAGRQRVISHRVARKTRELEESRRQLEHVMTVAEMVPWELDLLTGEYILPDRALAFAGTTAEREGGHRMSAETWLHEFVVPEDRPIVLREMEREAGGDLTGLGRTIEFRMQCRDGTVRDVASRFDGGVATDAGGRVTRLLGTTQDISAYKAAERALRASEEYSRSIVESSDDVIQVLDLDGRMLDDAHGETGGVPADGAVPGRDWAETHEDEAARSAARSALERAREGQTARFVTKATAADGGNRWWDVAVSPIVGADGSPGRLLSVSRDITLEREASETIERANVRLEQEVARRTAALAASEQQLEAIFDAAEIGIVHYTGDGKPLRVNPRFCAITGYDEAELLVLSEDHLIHPDDRAAQKALVRRLDRGALSGCTNEVRFVREDGTDIWVRVGRSVVRSADGEVLYHVAVCEDISEARAAVEIRAESERRYRDLFERNPMPMATYDCETLAYNSVNEAAIDHYGYSREEFLGMHLSDLRLPEEIPHLETLINALEPGYAPPRKGRHVRKDGSIITVEVSSHDVEIDGRASRLLLYNDVTERERTAALQEGQKKVLERVAAGAPLEETLELLARLLADCVPGARVAAQLVDGENRLVQVAADLPERHDLCARGIVVAESVAALGRAPSIVEDLATDEVWAHRYAPAVAQGLRACWAHPVIEADGEVLGLLSAFFDARRVPTDEEFRVLDTLANTAAIAIGKERERAALIASEERYRTTFESAALGIVHVDDAGRFVEVNPRVCEMTGYEAEELLGMTVTELEHPGHLAPEKTQRDAMWRGEVPSYHYERCYRSKDGSEVWVSVTTSPIRDEHGEIAYSLGLVEDITRRREVESKLNQQEAINRLLLENLSEAVIACDADGEGILMNRIAREWYGELFPHSPAGDWSETWALYESDGQTPLAPSRVPLVRALAGETVRNEELSIVREGSPVLHALASAAPIVDASGGEQGAVVVVTDVTERTAAEREVRQALATLDATRDAAFIFDPETLRFSYVNEGALRQVGYTRDELLAMTPVDIKPEFSEAEFRAILEPMLRGEQDAMTVQTVHRRKDGGEVPVEINLQYVKPAGAAPRFIAVVRDVTEQQRHLRQLEEAAAELRGAKAEVERERSSLAERVAARTLELTAANEELERAKEAAEAASRAKSAFLATVSHEIRTPMNGVLGAMELLEHSGLEGERAALLGTAQASASSLLDLVNDLLDMAKIEAGRIEIVPEPVAIDALVGDAIATHQPNALAKGIALTAEISPSVPAWMLLDVLRVRQVLGNLISNAVKFTDEGAVELTVASEPAVGGTHRLRFVVRDSGAGIPADVLPKLFRPFEQGPARLTRESGGTGLGLAICRGLAQRMGGTVNLTSVPGEGTVATLELVAAQSDARAGEAEAAREARARSVSDFVTAQGAAGPERPRVLAVDDHAANRQLLLRQLGQLGLAAEVVCDGTEALERLRSGAFQAVITDCEMPRMNGFELAEAIRTGGETFAGIPIVACTAHALPEVAQRCRDCGMDEVLAKPVQLADLVRALDGLAADITAYADAQERGVAPDAVLDARQFELVTGGDADVDAEMARALIEDASDGPAEMREALERGDDAQCAALAHRHKGACLTFGANALGSAWKAIEAALREGAPPAELARLADQLDVQARRLERLLRERIATADAA